MNKLADVVMGLSLIWFIIWSMSQAAKVAE
jgi:hypothetical protein